MQLWIIYVALYGILKGAREPVKKTILKDCGVLSTLFIYTSIGFLMSITGAQGIIDIPIYIFGLILVKSLTIVVAWIAAFRAIKKVPVSIYGITDTSRVIFSTLMGVAFLGEELTKNSVIGLVLVVIGLYIANARKDDGREYKMKYIWILILSCALNGVSGTLDKYIMSTGEITSSALQFWFMLTLSLMYLMYSFIKREKLEIKKCLKNPWIYVLSLSLVLGDRLLFIANSDPQSKVTIMTLIKQSSAVVTIILGRIIYKEKYFVKKLVCAAIIITGIMIAASF